MLRVRSFALLSLIAAGCSTRAGSGDGKSSDSSGDDTNSTETGTSVQPTDVRVWARQQQTCAIVGGENLRCWGRNLDGRLGMGATDTIGDDEHPSVLSALAFATRIVDVPMSAYNGYVIEESRVVHSWGANLYGLLGFAWEDESLGDDETTLDGPPVDFGAGIAQLAAGRLFSCAVYEDGGLRCWGKSDMGQTGYGSTETVDPVVDGMSIGDLPLVDVGASVKSVSAGDRSICAVTDQSTVRCWGRDFYGTLGQGSGVPEQSFTIGDDELPSAVPAVTLPGSPVVSVAVHTNVVCATHEDGAVTCWGEAGPALGYGEALDSVGLGYGDDEPPVSLGHVQVGGAAIEVGVGHNFACALLERGDVRCWGTSPLGQLGRGDFEVVGYPKKPSEYAPVDIGGTAIDLAVGSAHACVVLESGEVRCWGEGGFGATGYASTDNVGDDETPASVPPVQIQ